MFEFANTIIRWRYAITASALILAVLLVAPALKAHNSDVVAQVKASYNSQDSVSQYDSSDVVANELSQMLADAKQTMDALRLNALGNIMQAADGITNFDKSAVELTFRGMRLTFHGISIGAIASVHVLGSSIAFTLHIVSIISSFGLRTVGSIFSFGLHTVSNCFGFLGGVTHVSALIRPQDRTPTPTIKEMRAQQAQLIQSGTIALAVQATQATTAVQTISSGAGGACDNGEGNDGYPISWCNAPMDSIATLSYTDDPINRECTSYASWYFTTIESHTDFHAAGNAKYWATTSNYPTDTTPIVGAIAVETAGSYGHVAIVQALPGQAYAGQVVPAGYILVSEMNYDWYGHFRYSYSPLSKFATYIYP